MNEDDTILDDIPGMPSDEDLRSEISKTGSPRYWNPFGDAETNTTDLSALAPEAATRVMNARLAAGPGPHGNKYQWAVFERHRKAQELVREYEQLDGGLNEVGGYDPGTGAEIPAIQSPERRRAMNLRMQQITGELARIKGEPGERKLEEALKEAIKARKVAYRRQYVQSEAKRRAAQSALDAEIEKAAEGYRSAGGSQ